MNHSEREGVAPVSNRIISAAIIGWLVFLVGVLLSALVFHLFYIPEAAIPWVSGIFSYLASFITGFRAAKGARKKGFLKGFWAGVLFVAGYVVLTLIFSKKVRVLNSILLLVIAIIGGIVGINQKTKRNNMRKGITRL